MLCGVHGGGACGARKWIPLANSIQMIRISRTQPGHMYLVVSRYRRDQSAPSLFPFLRWNLCLFGWHVIHAETWTLPRCLDFFTLVGKESASWEFIPNKSWLLKHRVSKLMKGGESARYCVQRWEIGREERWIRHRVKKRGGTVSFEGNTNI